MKGEKGSLVLLLPFFLFNIQIVLIMIVQHPLGELLKVGCIAQLGRRVNANDCFLFQLSVGQWLGGDLARSEREWAKPEQRIGVPSCEARFLGGHFREILNVRHFFKVGID